MKEFADLCLKIVKIILSAISIGAFVLFFVYLLSLGLAYLIPFSVENHATEYSALCVKNEGKPVFNGKYWECMK